MSLDALHSEEAARIEELDRAQRAKTILEDDLFRAAVEALRKEAIQTFTGCDPKDHMALIAAQKQYLAVEDMVNSLLRHIETGTMARSQLGKIREAIERWKTGSQPR